MVVIDDLRDDDDNDCCGLVVIGMGIIVIMCEPENIVAQQGAKTVMAAAEAEVVAIIITISMSIPRRRRMLCGDNLGKKGIARKKGVCVCAVVCMCVRLDSQTSPFITLRGGDVVGRSVYVFMW